MKWNIFKIEKKHPTFAKEILHVYNKVITYQNVKTEYNRYYLNASLITKLKFAIINSSSFLFILFTLSWGSCSVDSICSACWELVSK